jgi:hypothetical protein
MGADGKTIGKFFDLQRQVYEKCLRTGFDCEGKAVRAHSIQNRKVLDLLQADNHVVMPVQKLSENDEPITEFSLIGRNNASTFTGLCAEHDAVLFKLADAEPLDVKNKEQLGQLAHRAVMRELHARLEWAYRIDSLHEDNVKNGLVSEDAPNPAIPFWERGWRVIRFRGTFFDSPMSKGKAPALEHYIIELVDQKPTVAASSLFAVEHDKGGDIVGAMLTVVPVDAKKTVAIVSYPKKQTKVVKKNLSALFEPKESDSARTELSKLIIQRVENFALAPIFYNTWPDDKKKRVLDAF